MRKLYAIALSAAVGLVGLSEGVAPAAAASAAKPASVEQVRASALRSLSAGDVQTVGHRGYRHRGSRGHRRGFHSQGPFSGRYYGGGRRYYRGRRHYGHRYYGGRRYYGRRYGYRRPYYGPRYYHRRHYRPGIYFGIY
ncbi:BA14K family protein [Hansschlegelia sp. KR7-227]|jgi:hypothetical protein|uniref:BA14K family protein n=1 Tax=Hansschlegelia sp. KR7-227 TaxID=3400914 RepID=UPI003BFE7C9D